MNSFEKLAITGLPSLIARLVTILSKSDRGLLDRSSLVSTVYITERGFIRVLG